MSRDGWACKLLYKPTSCACIVQWLYIWFYLSVKYHETNIQKRERYNVFKDFMQLVKVFTCVRYISDKNKIETFNVAKLWFMCYALRRKKTIKQLINYFASTLVADFIICQVILLLRFLLVDYTWWNVKVYLLNNDKIYLRS